MKLVRFEEEGKKKLGLWVGDEKNAKIVDVSDFFNNQNNNKDLGGDYNEDFFADDGIEKLQNWYQQNSSNCPVVCEDITCESVTKKIRLLSPVSRPSKIICIGLNYAKHAAEAGMDVPKEPVIFFKSTTAIVGANDNIVIPKGSTKTDWEVELAVVIGKKTSYVEESEAMSYVAGYILHNDVSERDFQLHRSGQWVKGKSCDTFAPLGPWLATADEIKNPHNLNLWLKVNGEQLQNSNTDDFVFDIPKVISHLSQFMTLLPGDIISTGTPFGVGLGLNPPRYLKEGDVVELGIDGLGTAKQNVVQWRK